MATSGALAYLPSDDTRSLVFHPSGSIDIASLGTNLPSSTVELSVSCRNLLNMNPLCVMYVQRFGSDDWKEFGRTEMVSSNQNPDFVKKFVVDYYFQEFQRLKFAIYHIVSKSLDMKRQEFLGKTKCTLGELVSSSGFEKPLTEPKKKRRKNPATLLVSSVELGSCKDWLTIQLRGQNLEKDKTDSFLKFSRTNEDGKLTVVHQTEVVKKNVNPKWRPFTIPVRVLCNGDYDRRLVVECLEWHRSGRHEMHGSFSTTAKELSGQRGERTKFELSCPKKRKGSKQNQQNPPTIELLSARMESKFTFLDFLKGGTEVQCIIAVDFTTSNGNPKDPKSLHYVASKKPNLYIRALKAVGEILQDYDTDKLFPAFGFGATVPPDVNISDDFHLNGDPNNPYCQGIDGVIEAYQYTAQLVQPHEYANFAAVINYAASLARQSSPGEDYFILLILTDGTMSDMSATLEAIVQASSLPLSIVIVGLGNSDFKAMVILDGDDVRLSSKGKEAERDIVQFVPFRDFISKKKKVTSEALLAKEVLAEVPDQFLSYMRQNGIEPGTQRSRTLPDADLDASDEFEDS